METRVKRTAKSTAKASRKCQRAIVQIDSSSTWQNRANRLQESVKIPNHGSNSFYKTTIFAKNTFFFQVFSPISRKSIHHIWHGAVARAISRHPCAHFLPFFELILIFSASHPPAQPVFHLQAVLRCNTGIKNMKIAWRGDLHICSV